MNIKEPIIALSIKESCACLRAINFYRNWAKKNNVPQKERLALARARRKMELLLQDNQ